MSVQRYMLVVSSVWLGATLARILTSIHQDLLGLERYVAYARSHWVSPWLSVPLDLIALTAAIVAFAYSLRADARHSAKENNS